MTCPFATPLSSGRQQGREGWRGGCQSCLRLIQRAPERTLLPSREGPGMQQPSRAELGEGIAVGELLPLVPVLRVLLPGTGQPEGRAGCCLRQLASSQHGEEPLLPRCRKAPAGSQGGGALMGGRGDICSSNSASSCQPCSVPLFYPARSRRQGWRQAAPQWGQGGGQQRGLGDAARAICPASAGGPVPAEPAAMQQSLSSLPSGRPFPSPSLPPQLSACI